MQTGAPPSLGAHVHDRGTRFAILAQTEPTLCLFDGGEERRVGMEMVGAASGAGRIWSVDVAGVGPGQRYGYRTAADPAKLLVDPYAIEIDRPFRFDPALCRPGSDTTAIVPRAIVPRPAPPVVALEPPLFTPGGLIYELNVRGFTMLHPDVPEAQRGTIRALAHPAVIAHLQRLRVSAVELMPIVAWIDERHLPPLGLTNAWGYNPVVPAALDPRLAPGGVADLRDTVTALRSAGIGVILDLVFNHTGESDADGPTLSMRGFGESSYYAQTPHPTLINDAGTGNTLDFAKPEVRALIVSSLRHFASIGVDGFRFDLAPILARSPAFAADAPIFAEIAADPLLADRIMIAEPWDIGPGGYQLGQFPPDWLEWNDRYRDDVRRFWRGDGRAGALANRLAGSDDIFGDGKTRTVNFIAAHDGFTLADTVAYVERHNHANGEANRDGHGDNLSWNGGVEGYVDDSSIVARRKRDVRALLATLFASRGTIMLTAGDEFGRSQQGNNNAYAQDNAISWVDWTSRDRDLEAFVAKIAEFRATHGLASVKPYAAPAWHRLDGAPMTPSDWQDAEGFALHLDDIVLRIDRRARNVALLQITGIDSQSGLYRRSAPA